VGASRLKEVSIRFALEHFRAAGFGFGTGLFLSLLDQLVGDSQGPVRYWDYLPSYDGTFATDFLQPTSTKLPCPITRRGFKRKRVFWTEGLDDVGRSVGCGWYGGQSCVWWSPLYKSPAEGKYHTTSTSLMRSADPRLYLSGKGLEEGGR